MFLLRNDTTDAQLFAEYEAAGVGSRSSDAVRTKARYRKLLCMGQCTFTPIKATVKRRRGYNERRALYREFRKDVEAQWRRVSVLVGVLFSSLTKFKLANKILSFEPATMVSSAPSRRKRLRSEKGGVTLPHFSNLKHFTDELIAWAATRIPLGSLLSEDLILMDSLCQVVHELALRRKPGCLLGSYHHQYFHVDHRQRVT